MKPEIRRICLPTLPMQVKMRLGENSDVQNHKKNERCSVAVQMKLEVIRVSREDMTCQFANLPIAIQLLKGVK